MKEKFELKDKTKTCVDCNLDWVFTAGEQVFYQGKGLHTPNRCPACRKKRKEGLELQKRYCE
jgi:hypothetical protein